MTLLDWLAEQLGGVRAERGNERAQGSADGIVFANEGP